LSVKKKKKSRRPLWKRGRERTEPRGKKGEKGEKRQLPAVNKRGEAYVAATEGRGRRQWGGGGEKRRTGQTGRSGTCPATEKRSGHHYLGRISGLSQGGKKRRFWAGAEDKRRGDQTKNSRGMNLALGKRKRTEGGNA